MTEPAVGRLDVGVGQPGVEREHRTLMANDSPNARNSQIWTFSGSTDGSWRASAAMSIR